jgi:hypothetical protein
MRSSCGVQLQRVLLFIAPRRDCRRAGVRPTQCGYNCSDDDTDMFAFSETGQQAESKLSFSARTRRAAGAGSQTGGRFPDSPMPRNGATSRTAQELNANPGRRAVTGRRPAQFTPKQYRYPALPVFFSKSTLHPAEPCDEFHDAFATGSGLVPVRSK